MVDASSDSYIVSVNQTFCIMNIETYNDVSKPISKALSVILERCITSCTQVIKRVAVVKDEKNRSDIKSIYYVQVTCQDQKLTQEVQQIIGTVINPICLEQTGFKPCTLSFLITFEILKRARRRVSSKSKNSYMKKLITRARNHLSLPSYNNQRKIGVHLNSTRVRDHIVVTIIGYEDRYSELKRKLIETIKEFGGTCLDDRPYSRSFLVLIE